MADWAGRSFNNALRLGGQGLWPLAKRQRPERPECPAWQAKHPNSLISQYPDKIGCLIWSLGTSFSWAGTTRGIC